MDAEFLKILVCPKCRSPLELSKADDAARLICTDASCALRYPIKDGIPVLLIDAADRSVEPPRTGGTPT